MKTLSIEIKKETTENLEIKIPSFFRNASSTFIGVFGEGECVAVTNYNGETKGILTPEIQQVTPQIWIKKNSVEITREEFMKNYNEALVKLSEIIFK